MPFKKGQSGNPKGKPKGAINKSNANIRSAVELIVNDNIEQLQDDLKALKPVQRVKFIIDLLSFTTPRLKAIEQTTEVINTPMITDEEVAIIRKQLEDKY